MDMTSSLRRLNGDKNRTDVENLYLKEMVQQDTEELFKEDAALDALVDQGTDRGLFSDASSEDFDDVLDDEDFAGIDDVADTSDDLFGGFTMVEL